MLSIDLNADLGEGCPYDHQLMPLISSANISCGAHAGEEDDIRGAIQLALQHNVAIGAHPSYPDRLNYGRTTLTLSPEQLQDTLLQQLAWLQDLVHGAGGTLGHVKPHGALYNDAARDPTLARHIAETVQGFDDRLTLVGLAGSELIQAGLSVGLRTLGEAFVDRRYCPDGTLMSRSLPGAVIENARIATQQALGIVQTGQITAIDGSIISVSAQTLCIHGDTPGAVALAVTLRDTLIRSGINVTTPSKPDHAHQ